MSFYPRSEARELKRNGGPLSYDDHLGQGRSHKQESETGFIVAIGAIVLGALLLGAAFFLMLEQFDGFFQHL